MFPEPYATIERWLSFVKLDFLSVECLSASYFLSVLAASMFPAVLAAACWLVWAARKYYVITQAAVAAKAAAVKEAGAEGAVEGASAAQRGAERRKLERALQSLWSEHMHAFLLVIYLFTILHFIIILFITIIHIKNLHGITFIIFNHIISK